MLDLTARMPGSQRQLRAMSGHRLRRTLNQLMIRLTLFAWNVRCDYSV